MQKAAELLAAGITGPEGHLLSHPQEVCHVGFFVVRSG